MVEGKMLTRIYHPNLLKAEEIGDFTKDKAIYEKCVGDVVICNDCLYFVQPMTSDGQGRITEVPLEWLRKPSR